MNLNPRNSLIAAMLISDSDMTASMPLYRQRQQRYLTAMLSGPTAIIHDQQSKRPIDPTEMVEGWYCERSSWEYRVAVDFRQSLRGKFSSNKLISRSPRNSSALGDSCKTSLFPHLALAVAVVPLGVRRSRAKPRYYRQCHNPSVLVGSG